MIPAFPHCLTGHEGYRVLFSGLDEIVNSRKVIHTEDGTTRITVDYICPERNFKSCVSYVLGESCSSSITGLPHVIPITTRKPYVFPVAFFDPEVDEFDVVGREIIQTPYIHRRPPLSIHFRRTAEGIAEEEQGDFVRSVWLHATKITQVTAISPQESNGVSVHDRQTGKLIRFQASPNYTYMRFTVLFEKKPYQIMDDNDAHRQINPFGGANPEDPASLPGDIVVSDRTRQGGGKREVRFLRYISRHVLAVAKFEKIPMGRMFWASDRLPEKDARHSLIHGSELIYSWHEVPVSHKQELRVQRYLGTVNQYRFNNFPPGTLRLDGMGMRTYRPYHGALLCDITLFVNYVDRNFKTTVLQTEQKEEATSNSTPGLGHNYVSIYGEPQSDDDIKIRFVGDVNKQGPYRSADWSYIFLPYDEVI